MCLRQQAVARHWHLSYLLYRWAADILFRLRDALKRIWTLWWKMCEGETCQFEAHGFFLLLLFLLSGAERAGGVWSQSPGCVAHKRAVSAGESGTHNPPLQLKEKRVAFPEQLFPPCRFSRCSPHMLREPRSKWWWWRVRSRLLQNKPRSQNSGQFSLLKIMNSVKKTSGPLNAAWVYDQNNFIHLFWRLLTN